MTPMAHRWTTGTLGAVLAATAIVGGGCGKTESTTATPPNSGTGMTGMGPGKDVTGPAAQANAGNDGAGGAPTYGEATGTGFASGDAAHSSGMGSGLMGFHSTGAMGTSAAASDMHKFDEKDLPKGQPTWVLPEQ